MIILVAYQSSGPCQGSRGIDATQSSVGYISSAWTAQHGDGWEQCPWIITARAGQRISITLLDFTPRVDDEVGALSQPGLDVCSTNVPTFCVCCICWRMCGLH